MTILDDILAAKGYAPREPQVALFNHLIGATRAGVIAQAGTGTGKSLAILAAATYRVLEHDERAIVVTPTLTLMDQYVSGDMPIAREAFPQVSYAELRGKAHYWCDQAKSIFDVMGREYEKGCEGSDGGCTYKGWLGCDIDCPAGCTGEDHGLGWKCDYQAAKHLAREADVVITNADMLIVNDRILAPIGAEIFPLEDSVLFVDEAHTLEQKLRDWASRSVWHKNISGFNFAGTAGPTLGRWLERQDNQLLSATRGFPQDSLNRICDAELPPVRPKDGLARQRQTQEACQRLRAFIENPHDNAVAHVSDQAIKMDWINISASAGELLTARPFGLVSATIPRTMAATLGVTEAPFVDVGHPFSYGKQAWLGFSQWSGSYRDAQADWNFDYRAKEVLDLIRRAKGGALLLFSAFRDLERLHDRLRPELEEMGLTVLMHDRDADKAELARRFKEDGNAVLFGSESFATGFDVPGEALRLVVIWKLPYLPVDPVSNAIRSNNFQRYEDAMRVRAVQAMGRLIRTAEDRGIVWWADSRATKLVDPSDPLTAHIQQFAKLG